MRIVILEAAMPLYEYYCKANRRTYEVRHSITRSPATLGELLEFEAVDCAGAPAEAPIIRLISAGYLVSKRQLHGGRSSGTCCGDTGCQSSHH